MLCWQSAGMKRVCFALGALAAFSTPLAAADKAGLTPSGVIAASPKAAWIRIKPADLLVMDIAPGSGGKPRRVVIQLMPVPFSQGWVANIRKLALAHWWDSMAIVRAQDNYVVQWGDPNGEDAAEAKPLPPGMQTMTARDYTIDLDDAAWRQKPTGKFDNFLSAPSGMGPLIPSVPGDPYAAAGFVQGWPVASAEGKLWPIHCYGMVGVGRGLDPDAGSGAELYTVIGQAPRHLDRNIAVVGRVIEGIENLSALPRGTGELGFYETASERVPIAAIRLGTEVDGLPDYEFLSNETKSFSDYLRARSNREDEFFFRPARAVDICNAPVPVRRVR